MWSVTHSAEHPRPPFIRRRLDRQRLALCRKHCVEIKLRVDDYIGAANFKHLHGIPAHWHWIFHHASAPQACVFLTTWTIRSLDLIFRDLLWKLLPRPTSRFIRQVVRTHWLRRIIANQALAWPQFKTHTVTLRRALEREQPVVFRSREEFRQSVNGALTHVGRIPGLFHHGRIHFFRTLEFRENNAPVLLNLMHGSHRRSLRRATANRVVSHHVGIVVVISTVIKNFRYRVSSDEPNACVFETSGLPHRFEQRRYVIAKSETITVEQLHRIQHFTHGFFIRPPCDVIPEPRLHETAVREKESPHSLGPLTWRMCVSLRVNAFS